MTRALLTQLVEAMELHAEQYPHMQKGYTVDATKAAREYLATEPEELSDGEIYSRLSKRISEYGTLVLKPLPFAWLRSIDTEPISAALKQSRPSFFEHHNIPLYLSEFQEEKPKQRDAELETKPSGERAELIAELKLACIDGTLSATLVNKAADMLEADVSIINEGNKAQQATDPSCPSCQSPGLMYECVYCSANSYPKGFAQQAKRVPMTPQEIRDWWASENKLEDCDMCKLHDFETVVRAVEDRIRIIGSAA